MLLVCLSSWNQIWLSTMTFPLTILYTCTISAWCRRFSRVVILFHFSSYVRASSPETLKKHSNEVDFLGFLHKSVRHRSLALHFEPFRFLLRIRGDIRNRKTTPRLAEPGSRLLLFVTCYSFYAFRHQHNSNQTTPRIRSPCSSR